MKWHIADVVHSVIAEVVEFMILWFVSIVATSNVCDELVCIDSNVDKKTVDESLKIAMLVEIDLFDDKNTFAMEMILDVDIINKQESLAGV